MHLNDCQTRNQDTMVGIPHQLFDAMGAGFRVVEFGQCARIEKVRGHSEPALAVGDYRLGPGGRVFRRDGPDLFNAGDIVHRIDLFLDALDVSEIEVATEWILGRINNPHRDLLMFMQTQRLQGSQHPIFVYGFHLSAQHILILRRFQPFRRQ